MKKVILYGNRNTGIYALTYLKAKGFDVKIISDDQWVIKIAKLLEVDIIDFEEVEGFDLFLCVHGVKILSKEFLQKGLCVNVHPGLKYKGKDPISRYIINQDEDATVDSHHMIEQVDEGEIIASVPFHTGEVNSYAEFYNQAVPFYHLLFELTLEKLNIKP